MPRWQPRARWLQPEMLVAGGIVFLALGVRLAWVLYSEASPTDGRFDDSLLYHLLAIGLRDDLRYVQPFTGLPTATWPPGYPFFLAAVYSLFGVSATAATVVNAFLGALTVAGLYVLGRLLFDQRTAALGALLLAIMPGQIFFAGILWSEVLFTLLFTLTLIFIVAVPRRPAKERVIWAVGVGVLVAGSAYVREAGLSLLIVAAVPAGGLGTVISLGATCLAARLAPSLGAGAREKETKSAPGLDLRLARPTCRCRIDGNGPGLWLYTRQGLR